MSLLKKLAGLAVGAAAVGAVAYVLQNREHHDDEYEHIWGPEDEVEPETDSAEPAADDASAETQPAAAAQGTCLPPRVKPEKPRTLLKTPAAKTPDFDDFAGEPPWSWVMLRHPARRTARSTPPRSLTPLWPAIGRGGACKGIFKRTKAHLCFRARSPFLILRYTWAFTLLPLLRGAPSPAGGYGIRPTVSPPCRGAHIRPQPSALPYAF